MASEGQDTQNVYLKENGMSPADRQEHRNKYWEKKYTIVEDVFMASAVSALSEGITLKLALK